jgi:excisionase family DNA binding protein
VTLTEAASYLGCTRQTLSWWCRAGAFPAVRCGGRWLISRARLAEWLRERGLRPLPAANDNDTMAANDAA